ncbi:hypothetical protein Pori4_00175 [Pseudomonas phage vB_PpuM-Pori-4]
MLNYDHEQMGKFYTMGNCLQTVILTFASGLLRAEMQVKIGGNCTGWDIIDSAVGIAYDRLEVHNDCPFIMMGDTRVEDRDERGEEWLKSLLIGAEIIAIESVSGGGNVNQGS